MNGIRGFSKAVLLNIVKFAAFVLGFFGALSFMRSDSLVFNIHASRVYGNWFNWAQWRSILWLVGCLVLFVYSVWYTKPGKAPPFRKIDFSLIVLAFAVAFNLAYHNIWMWVLPPQVAMIVIPVAVYTFAMFVLGEFVARLRDKTLLSTLYWLSFFRANPVWRPMGFIAMLLLAGQLYMMTTFISPWMWMRLFFLFNVSALTFFAAYFANLSKQYDRANEEKIRAERFKSELITNVSHDIKTPLTSIINYVDLLKKDIGQGTVHGQAIGYIQVLDKKSARLKSLIDDLMEASKAGTGNMRVDIQEINLGEILGQVAGEFEDSFADRGLTLIIRQPDEPVLIHSDNRHLYRALENLFSNTAKYALRGTRVFAEVALPGGKPCFILQNTSETLIELSDGEATEQFIRGDKSRQTDGSGLGLYIAKSLVELVGGKLTVSISGDLFKVEMCVGS